MPCGTVTPHHNELQGMRHLAFSVRQHQSPSDMPLYEPLDGPVGAGSVPQFPETSFNPITPPKIRTMQSILSGAMESPSTAIPRIAVPAAPMPVQTA